MTSAALATAPLYAFDRKTVGVRARIGSICVNETRFVQRLILCTNTSGVVGGDDCGRLQSRLVPREGVAGKAPSSTDDSARVFLGQLFGVLCTIHWPSILVRDDLS